MERCSAPDGSSDGDFRKEGRRTWARMIKKIYQVDPLVCPRCGFPMRVLSLIEDPSIVRKILDHLGLWDAQQRPACGTSRWHDPDPEFAIDFLPWPRVTIVAAAYRENQFAYPLLLNLRGGILKNLLPLILTLIYGTACSA